MMLSKTAFSQHLSISKIERDSIVSKIIRGNEAIENNKVLSIQILKRDSTIALQRTVIKTHLNTIGLKDKRIDNLHKVISNTNQQNTLLKKQIRRTRNRFILGGGVLVGILILTK